MENEKLDELKGRYPEGYLVEVIGSTKKEYVICDNFGYQLDLMEREYEKRLGINTLGFPLKNFIRKKPHSYLQNFLGCLGFDRLTSMFQPEKIKLRIV